MPISLHMFPGFLTGPAGLAIRPTTELVANAKASKQLFDQVAKEVGGGAERAPNFARLRAEVDAAGTSLDELSATYVTAGDRTDARVGTRATTLLTAARPGLDARSARSTGAADALAGSVSAMQEAKAGMGDAVRRAAAGPTSSGRHAIATRADARAAAEVRAMAEQGSAAAAQIIADAEAALPRLQASAAVTAKQRLSLAALGAWGATAGIVATVRGEHPS